MIIIVVIDLWWLAGVPTFPKDLRLNNLFFIYDSLLFCMATSREWGGCSTLWTLWKGIKTKIEERKNLSGVPSTQKYDKYLGLHALVGKSRVGEFKSIKDRVWKCWVVPPIYVGDQPLGQKKRRLRLCFCWPGTGHAQCVTCVQRKKKKKKKEKKKKERKMASWFFQLETEWEALVFEIEARANSVREERKIVFYTYPFSSEIRGSFMVRSWWNFNMLFLTTRATHWLVSIVGLPLPLLGCSSPLGETFLCCCWNPLL
jgi:hypothetical protein